jgi:hypothetical protein
MQTFADHGKPYFWLPNMYETHFLPKKQHIRRKRLQIQGGFAQSHLTLPTT